LNGKIAVGKFFVGAHGRYTAVSDGFFHYSGLHGLTAMTLLPVAVLAVAWFSWRQNRG
jgi:hypothetical protein